MNKSWVVYFLLLTKLLSFHWFFHVYDKNYGLMGLNINAEFAFLVKVFKTSLIRLMLNILQLPPFPYIIKILNSLLKTNWKKSDSFNSIDKSINTIWKILGINSPFLNQNKNPIIWCHLVFFPTYIIIYNDNLQKF